MVQLRGGLIVPDQALTLVVRLELAGWTWYLDGEKIRLRAGTPMPPNLTPADTDLIRRYKPHLMALVAYQAPDREVDS